MITMICDFLARKVRCVGLYRMERKQMQITKLENKTKTGLMDGGGFETAFDERTLTWESSS